MKTPLKSLIVLICFFFCVALLIPTTSFAEDDPGGGGGGITPTEEYNLLAPLPGMESVPASESLLGAYFSNIYQLGVSLVILLAVAVLIFGGIQYMMTDSFTKKGEARDTITAAIVGILLAVCSYAILTLLIGDRAISFDMNIENVTPREWVDTPERKCTIYKTGAQACLEKDPRNTIVGDEFCGQVAERKAGEVCCEFFGTGHRTEFVGSEYSGSCTIEELDSQRNMDGEQPVQETNPVQRCYQELVRHLSRDRRIEVCNYIAAHSEDYDSPLDLNSYIDVGELNEARHNPNSVCMGQTGSDTELRFYQECAMKGGFIIENEPLDHHDEVIACMVPVTTNSCESIAESVSGFTSPFGGNPGCCFGDDYKTRNNSYPNHTGVDIRTGGSCRGQNERVYPMASGRFHKIHLDPGGINRNGGNEVVIEHKINNELVYVRYLHLEEGSITAREGELADPSVSFARTNDSGISSSGPHLHIEFSSSGNSGDSIDPLIFFGGNHADMVNTLSGGVGLCPS